MQQIYGRSFTKKPHFGHSKNGKWIFRAKKMKTSSGNCLPFQDAPLCTIRYHFNKVCHECGHKIDHLAWKPWIFMHDRSFLRTFFLNNCCITSLLFFLGTWPHVMTQCEGFTIFWFFVIFYVRFKMLSKRREWPFLASGWILEFFWCLSD